MACKNCGTPESVMSARTGSANNTGYSDNFFMCACPEKPGRPMERPAIQFMAYKNTANDFDDAVDIIKKKRPPLRPGEPAVVPYEVHVVEDGKELKEIDHYDMILAIGGVNGEDPMIIPSLREIDSRIEQIAAGAVSDIVISEIQNNKIIQETITEIVKQAVGNNVVTKDQLDDAVNDAIQNANLVSADDVKDFVKGSDVDKKIDEKTASFVKADELDGLATKDEIAGLATKAELDGLATKDDVKNLVGANEVEKIIADKGFVTKSESDKAIAAAVAAIDIPEVPSDDHIKDLAKEVHDANMPEIPSADDIRTIAKEEAAAAAPSDDKIKEIVNTEIKSETTKETITSIVSETVTTDPQIEVKITEVVKKIDSSMSWKDDSGDSGWDTEIDGE